MRLKTLVAESRGFSPEAAELLRELGDLILADLNRTDLLQAVGGADVLWIRLRHKIDTEVFAAAPGLRFVVTPTTGLNHIDTEDAHRRGVRVLSLRGEVDFLRQVRATAEHTLALALALLRQIPAAATHVRAGGWDRDLFRGHELLDKVVGVVGYGRLGRLVAHSLKALGAQVLIADPHVTMETVESGLQLLSLDELLRKADIVTLHVAYSLTTHGFFGQREFSLMKEGSWFVNTSRGELVDEFALLAALRSRRIAGAALDVISDEHSEELSAHPLIRYARDHDTLIITPHIGGCTVESMAKTEVFMAKRLVQVVTQEPAVRPLELASLLPTSGDRRVTP
jgi:D-3-phosphoglycerate dehydrogenase / 2-oxoglutarate reductase